MANAITGTLTIIALASCVGVPVGILGGLYLAEAGGGRLGWWIRFTADVLNGLPSIVIGVFVYALVVVPMHRFSALAGGIALGFMMIPLVVRTTEDKILGRRTQEDLESRLVEQSRLLNENELELERLRGEIEIARKTEYDLRVAMIESDGRANAAAEDFKAETARLQTALDRANGERTRLAYELANVKRQVKDTRAA